MAPKITALMAEQAEKDGAEVKTRREINRPPPKPTPIPAPDTRSIERSLLLLEETIADNKLMAERQAQAFLAAIQVLTENKPIRLKVHRNKDRDSPEYLLMEYIDVIPVAYTRKLDS